MAQSFTGTMECDECQVTQEFELAPLNLSHIEGRLWANAEAAGWQIGTDDLCAECAAKAEEANP